jgi:hypothetical protein
MKTKNFIMAAALLSVCAGPVLAQGHKGGAVGISHGSMSHSTMKSHDSSAKSTRGTTSGHKTVGDKLTDNPKLASKIEKLLGNGMSAQDACYGFKNLGQCVAAVHISQNHLGISFTDLKAQMVDPATNTQRESLGKAIQQLRPATNAKVEAKKATKQAKADLKATHS